MSAVRETYGVQLRVMGMINKLYSAQKWGSREGMAGSSGPYSSDGGQKPVVPSGILSQSVNT